MGQGLFVQAMLLHKWDPAFWVQPCVALTMGATWLDAEQMCAPGHRWICAAAVAHCLPPSCALQSRNLKFRAVALRRSYMQARRMSSGRVEGGGGGGEAT